MFSGKFITLEGGEGAGKSTQLRLLENYISQKGFTCTKTREPGGTTLAQKLRALIVEPQSEKKADMAELLMIYAARADHLEKLIIPSLQSKKVVLCDRFNDSTIAYQHYARGINLDKIKMIDNLVVGGYQPQLTIIIDILPEVGLLRSFNNDNNIRELKNTIEYNNSKFDEENGITSITKTSGTVSTKKINISEDANISEFLGSNKGEIAFEMEGYNFHFAVRKGFFAIAKTNPNRYHIVDGNLPKEQVFEQVKIIVDNFFEKFK